MNKYCGQEIMHKSVGQKKNWLVKIIEKKIKKKILTGLSESS